MAGISQVNGKATSALSSVVTRAVSGISQIDGATFRGVTFSSSWNISAGPGTYPGSGTVTIVGTTATFNAFATVNTGGPVNTTITINGVNRTASQTPVGTNLSTTFTLSPGSYAYSFSVTISAGAGQGGIQFTQP